MDLNKQFVKAKNPCADGFRWFLRNFRQGGNYQELLDALVAADRVDDACWLLDQFGPTDTTLELDALEADALVFAGTVRIKSHSTLAGKLRTGGDLVAEGGVHCGAELIVGGSLRAGGGVRCEGEMQVAGDARVAGSLHSEGALRVGQDLRLDDDLVANSTVLVGGNLWAGGAIEVAGELQCEQSLQAQGDVQVAGALQCGQGIATHGTVTSTDHIQAGWGIRTGGDLLARGAIRAGESLAAGGRIEAGPGYGVFAGLDIPRDSWDSCARVHSSERPDDLFSGLWSGPDLALALR